MPGRRTFISLTLILLLLALPSAASARRGGDDRPEVRVAGSCGGGAVSKLKLKARDGGIEVEFEVQRARASGVWRITIVQEGRVAWRGRARARSFYQVERRIRDFPGADRVMVRGLGPRGMTCVATATLPG
jgi:hypothetical protein